jgi:hypothetical protein
MTTFKLILSAAFCGAYALLPAQEDLLSMVEQGPDEGPRRVYATFKTVRIANAQTIETVKKNHLDFRIAHRFGNIYNSDLRNAINNTFQTFFGFGEVSDVRFSLDYGLTEDITIGIGRNSGFRLIDGTVKWKILKQTADGKMPFSMAVFSSLGYSHDLPGNIYSGIVKDFPTNELHRFNFFHQIVLASKINEWLSLEILPSYMHRNFIRESYNSSGAADVNSFFSLGVGGRLKLSKRVSFIGDYFYNMAQYYSNNEKAYNPLALGFEIETGGHVFSLFFTNANFLIENNFIPYTTDTWTKGQIKFGFTISRTFAL